MRGCGPDHPPAAPAGTKAGAYLHAIAYLLKANKHVAPGLDSLRADPTALRKTRIAVGAP